MSNLGIEEVSNPLVIRSDFCEVFIHLSPGQKFLRYHGSSAEYILPSGFPCYNLQVHQSHTSRCIWLFSTLVFTNFVLNLWPWKNHHHKWLRFRLTFLSFHPQQLIQLAFLDCKNGKFKFLPVFWGRNAAHAVQFTCWKHTKVPATRCARPKCYCTTTPSHKFKAGEMAIAYSFVVP